MKKTESLSVVCSVLAICLSIIALFFQFFYSSSEFSLNIELDGPPVNQLGYNAVFINSGTSYVAVTSIEAYLRIFNEQIKQNVNHAMVVSFNPFVLDPGKIVQNNIKHELPFEILKKTEKAIAGLEIVFVDSKGVRYKANIDLLEILPDKDNRPYEWKHLGTGYIDLFKNAEKIEYENGGGVML